MRQVTNPKVKGTALAVWSVFGRFLPRVYLWRGSRADTAAALDLIEQQVRYPYYTIRAAR